MHKDWFPIQTWFDNDTERFLLVPRGLDVIFSVCNDLITTVHNFITWAGKFDHLGNNANCNYLGSSSHSDRFWG